MELIEAHLGEALALTTAVIWAFAVILFKKSGETVHPLGLNLFKSILAAILFIPTIYIVGDTLFRPAPAEEYILLLVSGVLGIGIADTLFFMSLNALGAGLSAIVDCLYSPFIIGLSFLWLGESLNTVQLIGVMMILSAVLSVTREGRANQADRRKLLLGILWGALAMASMAVGIVMIKPLLDRSPLLWVTEIRLIGGIIVIALVILIHPARRKILGSMLSTQRWGYTLSGSFIGTYLAMIVWLAGMKFTQASTAAALNQTSNIFIFIFAALLLRERITPLRIAGIILAATGAMLVTFG
ncbi:DMT family transporter [Candidatus Zixiibacteriota bacterium]